MRHLILTACIFLAGACDMPIDTDQNDLPLVDSEGTDEGSSSDSGESGDLPIVEPDPEDPPSPVQEGDYIFCADLPDRTVYACHFDNPYKCEVMIIGITWDDILSPGYFEYVNALAESKRTEWGVAPETEMVASWTFNP